jgi:AraC-like DNA-binding protein
MQRPPMQRLSPRQTRTRLERLGIEEAPADGFGFVDDARRIAYDWHCHRRHQLLYAFAGSARVELEGATLILPPQRAVFIPAGVRHATVLRHVRGGSVYLAPRLVPLEVREPRVIAATPLLREMMAYAARWPPQRDRRDRAANLFFRTLGQLCGDWLQEEITLRFPRARTPETARALDHLLDAPGEATMESAAGAAGMSARTLRRRLDEELGTAFRALQQQARVLRAMELLARAGQRVTDVALAVGYDSMSAFTKSFRALAGETPRAYRARAAAAKLR